MLSVMQTTEAFEILGLSLLGSLLKKICICRSASETDNGGCLPSKRLKPQNLHFPQLQFVVATVMYNSAPFLPPIIPGRTEGG
jgi:hypothetical protein